MPPNDPKSSNALTLLRRVGTEPIMSLVRVKASSEFSSAMTRMILRNIHLALISRKNEIVELNATENERAPEQRDDAEPVLQRVRVAVKPGGPKTDMGHWVDAVAFEGSSKKFKGLTSNKRANKPSFVFKEIGYDEWRKHYAKDKFGRYRGTEAPAEDTILIPEDEVKWRSPPVKAEADQPAESEEVLPFIEPVKRSATLPELQENDPSGPSQPVQASKNETEQEEAIFVDESGHTASRIVQETKIEQASPSSPAAPIFLSPPTSPMR